MNDLVLLCLILYTSVRIIGLGVSIDFFYETRDKKFILFIISWFLWILGSLFPILSDIAPTAQIRDLYLVFNVVYIMSGGIFYLWGLLRYFMYISFKFMICLMILLVSISFILYLFINSSISISFSVLILNILMISIFIIPPLKKKDFKIYIGKSIRWFYATIFSFIIYLPISVMNFLFRESYGLYNSDNTILIIFNYVPTISSFILLIVLLVHLEYSTSFRQKFDLKDRYSHNLGNIMQVILSSAEIIKKISNVETSEKEKLEIIDKKCKEASKLIKEIREI